MRSSLQIRIAHCLIPLRYINVDVYSEGDDQQNTITYTYLQHENMETVLDWINLILYTKFNLMQDKYPTYKKEELANMLNCGEIMDGKLCLCQLQLLNYLTSISLYRLNLIAAC